MTWMHVPVLAAIALVELWSHANAQERCPELMRLRSEAAAAAEHVNGVSTSDRCEAHIRFSMTWREIVRYANDHRDFCDISTASLSELEKRYREAAKARDNVCARRPHPSFPPDIIQR